MRILLLAGNTLRSRAYAQQLSHFKEINVIGLFYGSIYKKLVTPELTAETKSYILKGKMFLPNLSILLQETFETNGWGYNMFESNDINSFEIIQKIIELQPDLVIFSGYGGQILSKDHFVAKIPYLHIHPGYLPEERGSTTLYYSILNRRKCNVTAFFMTPEIDKGVIIKRKQYPIPSKQVNIDYWYDNIVRADCLKDAINILFKKNKSYSDSGDQDKSQEYYVIHPVLKHIAVLITEQEN